MCIGNSITQSDKGHYSYRYHLWKMLVDAELDFDFVGTQQNNKDGNPAWPAYKELTFDSSHEGHWGWSIEQALNGHPNDKEAGKLEDWLKNYTPDVVLLHFGTNDMFRNHPLPETLTKLRRLVALLRGDNPNVIIFMAKLIPAYDQKVGLQAAFNIGRFNNEIPALVQELHTQESPVILIDQHHNFDPFPGKDSYDGVHPNESGEKKMAGKWFNALQPYVKTNTPTATKLTEEAASKIKLYPTVTGGKPITVEVNEQKPLETLDLAILSKEGKIIQKFSVKTNLDGNAIAQLTLSHAYASGLYLIKITSHSQSIIKRIVIVRE